jgi:polyferredoxin
MKKEIVYGMVKKTEEEVDNEVNRIAFVFILAIAASVGFFSLYIYIDNIFNPYKMEIFNNIIAFVIWILVCLLFSFICLFIGSLITRRYKLVEIKK